MSDSYQTTTDNAAGPDTPSSAYKQSEPFWKSVGDILRGVEAMRHLSYGGQIGGTAIQFQNVTSQLFAQSRGLEPQSPYLPKFPNEPYEDYDRRRRNSFLTNVYADVSGNLAGKPFSKTCELAEDSAPDLVKLQDDVDGLGNNLHVFAREVFRSSLNDGITWILCDYTKVPPGATLADERQLGARPYWVHLDARDVLAVYSSFLNGQEVIFHARVRERTTKISEDYDETEVTRVREMVREPITNENDEVTGYGPATWTLYEEDVEKDKTTGKTTSTWEPISTGTFTLGFVPLVPVILGRRVGTSWRVEPPLRDLVYMQIKLFQMESNLDSTKELTAFPMLCGEGVSAADENGNNVKVPVGPRGVLMAPMAGDGRHGSWKFIEPSSSSLQFLSKCIDEHKSEMRDLGMQPLTAANLTVITTANISMKAHSLVQAWALGLKDALEQAWKISATWLGRKDEVVSVKVHTDFGVDFEAGSELATLLTAEAQGVLSPQTTREEFKRRGVLSDDYDEKEEELRLAKHQEGQVLQPEKKIDPVTGMPIVVKPKPGVLNPPPAPSSVN